MKKCLYIVLFILFLNISLSLQAEYKEFLKDNQLFVYVRADLITELDEMSIEEQDLVIASKVKKRAIKILTAYINQRLRFSDNENTVQNISSLIVDIKEIDSIEREEYVEAYYIVTLKNIESILKPVNETK